MDKKKIGVIIILLGLVLTFIWGHSLAPKAVSAEESTSVASFLQTLLDTLHIPITLTNHTVRKLAHFTEHAAAGVLLGLLFFPFARSALKRPRKALLYAAPFALGFLIGLTDETIQLFSGRGAMFRDVLIDLAGASFGALLSLLILYLKGKRRTDGNEDQQKKDI